MQVEGCQMCRAAYAATLSGHMGNVVASHAEGCRVEFGQGRFPAEAAPIYTVYEALREYCP